MSSARAGANNEIFCSYAPKDRPYIETFQSHLSHLQREGLISCWYDGLIEPGQHKQRQIETHLNSANIILLFISADFFTDDLCMNTILSTALQRSNRKDALVIPVLVRQCDWQTAPFAHLQVLPKEGKPIAAWRHRDEAYTEIVKSIRTLIGDQQVPPMCCSLLNLPLHRNRLFTGREEILHRLHASLEVRKDTALMQAIKGLGGIGKTQTAIEYAYRYQDHYTCIIWLNAESRETVISDVTELAREINTPGCYDRDQNIIVRGFLTWLETQRNWLLILDNVEDITLVRSFMPKGNHQGHLLFTTRRQAVGGAIEGISLDAMDEETGAIFLLKRAKRIAVDLPLEQILVKEMQRARDLSRVLGGLPLALDQAGGYIERKQCSIGHYLQIYEQGHERLLAESGFPEDTTDYKHLVATTWSLSFQQIAQEKHGQAGTDLLRLCAFLAPDNIPVLPSETVDVMISLLGPDLGPVAADPLQLDEALESLLKYSLIRREDDALFIHRLVQTVLRDAMTEEERSLWTERAILFMMAIFPDPREFEYWPVCQYLLPHMLACVEWIAHTRIRTQDSAYLLSQTACYLESQGRYKEAEPLYEEALATSRKEWGEKHLVTGVLLNNLAGLYKSQGRYEEAEPLYKESLAIKDEESGEQDLDTVTTLNNLAGLYKSQGRYEEAEPLYKEVVAITHKELGGQHPTTARYLDNLALLYVNQGRYEEAEPLHKEALKVWFNVFGEQHPDTATTMNNLANVYEAQGRYEEAELVCKQALAIRLQVLGTQHSDTAMSLDNLASIYRSQGRYEEAEPLHKEALEIWFNVFGEQHPDTAIGLNNLAMLYKSQGQYEEAELLYQWALAILINVLGEMHPTTQTVFSNYTEVLSDREEATKKKPRSTFLQWIKSLPKK